MAGSLRTLVNLLDRRRRRASADQYEVVVVDA
jgi:hypothetical protein